MAISTAAVGKTYAPSTYAVGREKIREYAAAVGETNPLHLDLDHAREAGYRDLVAPPMFCVVYCGVALGPVMFDRQVGLPGRILHGLWTMAQVARAQTEAAGGPHALKRLSVTFRGTGVPEHELIVTGTVESVKDGVAIVHAVVEQDGRAIVRRAEAELQI